MSPVPPAAGAATFEKPDVDRTSVAAAHFSCANIEKQGLFVTMRPFQKATVGEGTQGAEGVPNSF
jgi:hypothetical protein